ncbi:MAG: hypothetical protein NVSMB52_04640 [Chloroflexota bacterium]
MARWVRSICLVIAALTMWSPNTVSASISHRTIYLIGFSPGHKMSQWLIARGSIHVNYITSDCRTKSAGVTITVQNAKGRSVATIRGNGVMSSYGKTVHYRGRFRVDVRALCPVWSVNVTA